MTTNDTTEPWKVNFFTDISRELYDALPVWAQECTGGWDSFQSVKHLVPCETGPGLCAARLLPGDTANQENAAARNAEILARGRLPLKEEAEAW